MMMMLLLLLLLSSDFDVLSLLVDDADIATWNNEGLPSDRMSTENATIIHTKFIFKVDTGKRHLVENSFIYLYDINCVYHKIEFDNIIDLQEKIEDVVDSNDFGEDIQILSDFIEAPAMFLNYYMKRAKITDYSVFDVEYSPKFKTTPCDQTTFDFKVNINNNSD